MLKVKTNLEKAKALLICAETENGFSVEFAGTTEDQILLTAQVIEAFGKSMSKEMGIDPKKAIKSICSTALLGLELGIGGGHFDHYEKEKKEEKSEEKKTKNQEEKEEAMLDRLEKLMEKLENLKKKEC